MIEEHFFFEGNGAKLFGFTHSPEASPKTGFVFCSPFIEEKVRSQRLYVNFARLLSSKGYPVMRFDYMGYGDSEGAFEDATVDSMVDDTLRAIAVLSERANVNDICLFGGRLGGTIAAVAAGKSDSVKSLFLWDPITDGYAYIYKCLRTNLSMQTLRHGKILYNREKLIEMILAGELVNIDGYLIGSSFYKSIQDLHLRNHVDYLPGRILITQVAKRELPQENDLHEFVNILKQAGRDTVFSELKDAFSWESQKFYRPRPRALFENSLDWIKTQLT